MQEEGENLILNLNLRTQKYPSLNLTPTQNVGRTEVPLIHSAERASETHRRTVAGRVGIDHPLLEVM